MTRHLYIGGVLPENDRWKDYVSNKGSALAIEQELTSIRDSAKFSIKGEEPFQGEEVVILDDSIPGRLFAGIIKKVELIESGQNKTNVWSVDCDDYTELLDKKLINEVYENVAGDAVFRDLLLKYFPDFTGNGIQGSAPIVESFPFEYVHGSEAFNSIAEYTGRYWYPDYYKDIKYFSPDDLTSPAPMEIVLGAHFRNLRHKIDTQGLCNRVYVRGGKTLSDTYHHQIVADGLARAWVLPHKAHQLSVKVGAADPVTPGIENLDVPETKVYLQNFQERRVVATPATPTPVDGITVDFAYKYDIDIITVVEDLESQAKLAAVQGVDGVYEHSIIDESITSVEAAEALGQKYINEHGNAKVRGSFETEIPGWAPGQLVDISLPDRGITGTYLIQKVTISPATADKWTYKVEYGGRLYGIADYLKALVSAQQKKQIGQTNSIYKFVYGTDRLSISDDVAFEERSTGWKVEHGQRVRQALNLGEDIYNKEDTQTDFSTGILTNVTATANGGLSLTGAISLSPNLCPDFSEWTLSGGATLSNGVLTLSANGATAVSPPLPVDYAGDWCFSADYYSAQASPYPSINPNAGLLLSSNYHDAAMNPVYNANNPPYQGNGAARPFPLNAWTRVNWAEKGGPNVRYVVIQITRDTTYSSPSYQVQRPMMTTTGEWQAYRSFNGRGAIKWQSLTNTTAAASTNRLTKTAGSNGSWDADATSVLAAASGDCSVEFRTGQTNGYIMVGLSLSTDDASASYTDIDFAIYPQSGGILSVYEKGASKGSFGTYAAGDLLKVACESGVVKYYKNGSLIYTSSQIPLYPLGVDTSFYNTNTYIYDCLFTSVEGSSFAYQTSGNRLNPTVDVGLVRCVRHNRISWVAQEWKGGRTDGTNGYIDLPLGSGHNPATAPFEIEMEVYVPVLPAADVVLLGVPLGSGQALHISINPANKWCFVIQSTPVVGIISVTAALTKLKLSLDGSTAQLYVDNNDGAGWQLAGSQAYTGFTLAGNFAVGKLPGDLYFAKVFFNYIKFTGSLSAAYYFYEMTGTVIHDSVGSAHGIASGGFSWHETKVTIDTSIDNGTTWQQPENGAAVPGIDLDDDLTGLTLLVRETLTSTSEEVTPLLRKLEIDLGNWRVGDVITLVGSMARVLPLNPTWPEAQWAKSSDGMTWTSWEPVNFMYPLDTQGAIYFRLRTDRAYPLETRNYKKPSETDTKTGEVIVWSA